MAFLLEGDKAAEYCVQTGKSQDVLSVPLVFLTQTADESGSLLFDWYYLTRQTGLVMQTNVSSALD